jgi:hypothetical protein
VTIESKSGKSGFRTFVIIGIVIILLIYGFVTYEYIQNKNLKNTASSNIITNSDENIPTPSFDSKNIAIENGSIVYKTGDLSKISCRQEFVSYNRNNRFSRVVVSPDNQKLCFESVPPSTKPALFVSDNFWEQFKADRRE